MLQTTNVVSCCLFPWTRKQSNWRMTSRFYCFVIVLIFLKLRLYQANTSLLLSLLFHCDLGQSVWKIIISLHRTFFILASLFLGYWGALLLNVLTMTAAAGILMLLVLRWIHPSVCHIALSAVWLCVAQRYVYSRHIIKYVRYYHIYIKLQKKSMTFFSIKKNVAVEVATQSYGLQMSR